MISEFLQKPSTRPYAIGLIVVAVLAAIYSVYTSIRPEAAVAAADSQMFVDAKTGTAFSHSLKIGESIPVTAPSGEATGYPGTACYWNADGTTRSTPFWLVTNEAQGLKGPTFCPDCGRLIVDRAGVPSPGDKPPLTKAQYEQMRNRNIK